MPLLEEIAEDDSHGYDKETHGETCCIQDTRPPGSLSGSPDGNIQFIIFLFKFLPFRRSGGKNILDFPGARPVLFNGSPSRQPVSRSSVGYDGRGPRCVRRTGCACELFRRVHPGRANGEDHLYLPRSRCTCW